MNHTVSFAGAPEPPAEPGDLSEESEDEPPQAVRLTAAARASAAAGRTLDLKENLTGGVTSEARLVFTSC
jgi:hypothetical protein